MRHTQTETIIIYIGDPDGEISTRLSQPVVDLPEKISKSKTSITLVEEALPSLIPSADAKEEGILVDTELIDLTDDQPILIDLTGDQQPCKKLSKAQRRRQRAKIVKDRHQSAAHIDNFKSSRLHHTSLKLQKKLPKRRFSVG